MSTSDGTATVTEPIPIFKLAHRFVLYDVNHVTYLRREHNISGVLMGTLPQASQQNVFLGLPLELMPEEARLLVEKNVAYIVDDTAEHKRNFLGNGLSDEERRAYQMALRKQGQRAALDASKRSDDRKKAALSKKQTSTENWNDIPDDMFAPGPSRKKKAPKVETAADAVDEDELLFSAPANASEGTSGVVRTTSVAHEAYGVTPTTSQPPLKIGKPDSAELPQVPTSYPLYKHLHEHGYFMAPGLRFGCQYMAYPGDPLRFHSHFLCRGMDWDQEFSLIDLVGGGRLGTGVKKGFLVGGEEQKPDGNAKDASLRAFGVEWAGM
ncbi:putative tRNA-splicing endonuclease, tRNA intron endonuclease, catalytic domain-containing protein [Septoria linicola]|nr:putative tRNA-splicing endonuclease, tRNA intron endonuclease, catalytic domain-containing protein [Septoria linicola]